MARPSYSPAVASPQSIVLPFLTGGALTAFVAKVGCIKFRMPQRGQILGLTLDVNQKGGTHATSTLTVKAGADALIGAAFDVAAIVAGTPVDKEGVALTAAAADVAQGTLISVDLGVTGGTSPTWADATLQIDYVPR